MGEEKKISKCPSFCRDIRWEHFPNWTRLGGIFSQDCGLPPFLEPGDLDWIDWAKRRLDSFSWPSFAQSPLLSLFDSEQQPKTETAGHQSGVSEVQVGLHSWKVSLDVNHFMPEDITVATKEGFLLISGNHEERQDVHGVVSRCFTRKYKLPRGVDIQRISSSLSADGMLSVEAPVPEPAPAGTSGCSSISEVVVPVQIKQTQSEHADRSGKLEMEED